MNPRMVVVAGPPGSGKSTLFPVAEFGIPYFNADDRAAQMNGGSYLGISQEIRNAINLDFESFVQESIVRRESFAIETTLRSEVTFRQASAAKQAGFLTEMRYLALRDFELHLDRVRARADAGGHSAPVSVLRRIHEASLVNLRRALREFDLVWVYDNTEVSGDDVLLMEAQQGAIELLVPNPPLWLATVLEQL